MCRYNDVFKRNWIITMMLALVCIETRAQYDVSFSHYFDMEPTFNPASVGKQSVINVTGTYAIQLAGFKRNPQTMYFAGDAPFYGLKTYHGAGIQLFNDQIGLFKHQRLSLQYALRTRLAGGMLGIGVQGGLLNETFDGSKLDLITTNDPVFATSQVEGSSLDLAAGLYYTHKSWYVGLSATHLTSPLVELGETNELQVDRTFYLTGGYNIKLRNPFLSIKSSFLVRTDLVAYRGDITGRLVYTNDKKLMYAGIGCSPTNSVTFYVGGSVQGIMLGYSYEVYTSAINPANGSHELFVGYHMDVNLVKKGRNLHKIVRIL